MVGKCTGTWWKSSSEIESVLKTHTINLAILSSYFDAIDYTTPIHHFMQDKNMLNFVSSLSQRVEFQIQYENLII